MKSELIWCVETGSEFSSKIYSRLFLAEDEARQYYDDNESAAYRNIYQTRDIWNWREKEIARRREREENDDRTNVKRFRESLGITQKELSERSGVSIRMIQHYEQGSKDINAAAVMTIYKLAQALECTVEDLIEK